MTNDEVWKPIMGYEGIYEISNLGRVKSLNYNNYAGERVMAKVVDARGYVVICLRKYETKKNFKVHRLVAIAFLENPNDYPIINHIDEDKTNNNVDNLEWCTQKHNVNHGSGIKRRATQTRKPILQYDKSGNLVKRWDSASDAEKIGGYRNSHISQCCHGHRKSHLGYTWVFESEVV